VELRAVTLPNKAYVLVDRFVPAHVCCHCNDWNAPERELTACCFYLRKTQRGDNNNNNVYPER